MQAKETTMTTMMMMVGRRLWGGACRPSAVGAAFFCFARARLCECEWARSVMCLIAQAN